MQPTLDALQIAALFLDEELRICGFTTAATEFYDVTESDIGRPLVELTPTVPDMTPLPEVNSLDHGHPVEELIRSPRGRAFVRRVFLTKPSGNKPQIAITFNDVTPFQTNCDELLKSRTESRRLAERLKAVTDVTPVMIAYVDADQCYEFVNKRYAERFGQSPEDILGRCVAETIGPENYAVVGPHLRRALQGERVTFEFKLNGVRDAEPIFKEVTYVPDFDGRGNVTGCHVFAIDITKQQNTLEQVKLAEERLEEARRVAEAANESKSEFLANMSHEIRTPMSAIMGYTDILSRQLTDPDDIKCASVIRRNGKFLLEIINDILDISKIEAGKLELNKKRFRPDRLVADVCSLMEIRAAEKEIPLDVTFDGKIPKTIRSDDKRLKQILVNLIGNAIKFTKQGGVRIVVSFHNVGDRQSQPSGASNNRPYMQFDVIDTGIGMNAQQLETLFEPFTQGDSSVVRRFEGTGLGLSISQRLARMLGGEITVESTSQVGSKFSLVVDTGSVKSIPMIEPEFGAPGIVKPSTDSERPKLRGRILVVDDRRDMIFLAQHLIEDAGGTVTSAENGLVAIDKIAKAENEGRPFDLVTMDMQMPVLDGYEATRRLRKAGCETPIVAVTAHAMQGDRDKCIAAGCSGYITKPLDGPTFLRLLSDHLNAKREGGINSPYGPTSEVSGRKPQLQPGNVLVVDDAVDACRSLKTLLEFSGHHVEVAHDGASAIERAAKLSPAIVVLDLGLPDMCGFDVLRELRQLESLCETVFIAATGRQNQDETLAGGFDHHFVKPIDVAKLETLIQQRLTTLTLH